MGAHNNIVGLSKNNQIIGNFRLINSKIIFKGKNNIFFCEPGVTLKNSSLYFNGDNSIVFLGTSIFEYKLKSYIHNNSVLFIDRSNYINKEIEITLSEEKHCVIGRDGIYSYGIIINNSDQHIIYDVDSKQRINHGQSIFLGDHVWCGHDVIILKGTQVDSGSIIGCGSVLSKKKITSNSMWAGNPAKKIRNNKFWNGDYIANWKHDALIAEDDFNYYIKSRNLDISDDIWVYKYNKEESITFNSIDEELSLPLNSPKKLEFLKKLVNIKNKNRFVHNSK